LGSKFIKQQQWLSELTSKGWAPRTKGFSLYTI
jgi:hypothetical protein